MANGCADEIPLCTLLYVCMYIQTFAAVCMSTTTTTITTT